MAREYQRGAWVTLSTSDIKKQWRIYIIAVIGCIFFASTYEAFSHGVYSNYMIYAFLIPLIMGAGVSYILYFINKKSKVTLPGKFEKNMYNAAVATLTFGSIFNGVLEIYGTTNSKVYVYLVLRNITSFS